MERPVFALRIRAEPGIDAIRSLRIWLKRGLRDYGLRCVEIRQLNDGGGRNEVQTESAVGGASLRQNEET